MDPYDDYDPSQYVYDDESDQEEIVYLEGPVPGEDPFLPYLAKDVELSQSQSQPLPEQVVPNLLPRRERQRRRTEAAAQMHAGESSGSETSDGPENDEQDSFASLQSLLEKRKETGTNESKEVAADENKEGQPDGSSSVAAASCADSATEHERDEPTEVPVKSFTQPEFPLADDWEPLSQPEHTQQRTRARVVSASALSQDTGAVSSGLAKELQRQRKRKQRTTMPQPQPSVREDSLRQSENNGRLMSELAKNRKRAQKRTDKPKKKQAVKSGFRREQVFSQTTTSQTNSASIVGSRPQHWCASRTPALPVAKAFKGAVSPRSSHFAAEAAARQKTRRTSTSSAQPARSSLLPRSARSPSHRQDASNGISFAPPFIRATKTTNTNEDTVEDVPQSQRRTAVMQGYQTPRILERFNQSATFSAGSGNGNTPNSGGQRRKRHATKKLKAGPLMKRLRAIRNAVDGDRVRFQSGMYPFTQSAKRRFDLSDPRSRATSYMDVSVVGEPVPWDENERVTALAFVHNNETLRRGSEDEIEIEFPEVHKSGCFAWISFTYETAREQKLCRGSRLRIYNAISVPSKPMQLDGLGAEGVVKDRICDQTIICTQLCEAYPNSLPALPNVM